MTGAQARAQLARALSPQLHALLETAVAVARSRGLALYLVGGPVRDALMERPVSDLDLVVEGDAWPPAEDFAGATGGRLTRHERFRTAVVEGEDAGGWSVDWVTARRERYAAPAALPDVEPATIQEDLARRDFTINALALRLDRPALLDPFAAGDDLRRATIRVLHDASFVDDPTRLLRAARFAARWGFTLDEHTLALARAAIAARLIARTSAQRILHELWLALEEPRPERVLDLLDAWGAMPQLGLAWSEQLGARFAAARDTADDSLPEVYLALLFLALDEPQRRQLEQRYNLPADARRMLRRLPAAAQALQQAPLADAMLDRLLAPYTTAELRALSLSLPPAGATAVERYGSFIRPLAPLLTGDDLKAAGLKPGPIFAELLAQARRLQLEGTLLDGDDARRWLSERTRPGAG